MDENFNRDTFPFLSRDNFSKGEKINEYFIRNQKDRFYYQYIPLKKSEIQNIDFYVYEVIPMSGNGIDESLGESPFNIVFNFQYGEIYRSTHHDKKVLSGFEGYVKDFKW